MSVGANLSAKWEEDEEGEYDGKFLIDGYLDTRAIASPSDGVWFSVTLTKRYKIQRVYSYQTLDTDYLGNGFCDQTTGLKTCLCRPAATECKNFQVKLSSRRGHTCSFRESEKMLVQEFDCTSNNVAHKEIFLDSSISYPVAINDVVVTTVDHLGTQIMLVN